MNPLSKILLSIFLIGFANANTDIDKSVVYELTLETFNRTVTEVQFVVVEFYAPWCGACRKFEPIYERLAEKLKDVALLTRFDAVDKNHSSIVSQYAIGGYPTLYFFKNGEPEEFTGDVFARDLEELIRKKSKPTCRTLTNIREFGLATELDRVVIIGFFANETSQEYTTFFQIAKSKNALQMTFAAVLANKMNEEDLKILESDYSIKAYPHVLLYKTFDEGLVRLSSENFHTLEEFIAMHDCPLLADIDKSNSKIYINTGVPLLFFFINSEEQKKEWSPILKEVALEYRGKIHLVFIDFNLYGIQSPKLGLSGNVIPAASIEDTLKKLRYPFDETHALTETNFRSWVAAFMNGTLIPKYRTQPVPEPSESPVKEVVGDTLNETVLNGDKDVFLEFYAPWCGHCKALAPVWEQLAIDMKNEPIVIAKFDAAANDIQPPFDDIKITMFPTLYYFKKSDVLHPVQFQEKDRSLYVLKAFIEESRKPVASETTPEVPLPIEEALPKEKDEL